MGKTTSTTSSARFLARKYPQKKILVFSTDPAHSLSDSFAQEIGDEPISINGFENLYSMELNFKKVYEAFVREYEFELIEMAERSSYFGIKHMSNAAALLSYPTSFEFMVTIKLIELSNFKKFDLVMVDTAPTGHTLKFLELLNNVTGQFKALERSQERHRYILTRYYGGYKKDRVDKFLDMMKKEVEKLRAILRSHRAEFVVVTIAEEMAIWETKRLLEAIRFIIPNKNIIVNGLSYSELCPLCSSRKKEEENYLNEIASEFPNHNIIRMPLFPYEIRGRKLDEYAEFLQGRKPFEIEKVSLSLRNQGKEFPEIDGSMSSLDSARDGSRDGEPVEPLTINPEHSRRVDKLSDDRMDDFLDKENRFFLLFGGKGGVGKTTSAAATSVSIARNNPHKKVLVFSTDPAHSLADSFDLPITKRIALIEGFSNLWGLQIDPEDRLEEFRARYKRLVKEAFKPRLEDGGGTFSSTQSMVSHPFDKETILNLVSLAPLGLDEIMSLSDVVSEHSPDYDCTIIDTAPTGHLVKLLQRPEIVLTWFSKIIQGMKTYSGMMRSTFGVTRELLDARREIMKTLKILTNDTQTEFVVVTIAEFMGIYETERLVTDLENLKVASRYIIVNKILPPGKCPFCSGKRSEQLRYIEETHNKFPRFQVVETPLYPHEVRGVDGLIDFSKHMYHNGNIRESKKRYEGYEGIVPIYGQDAGTVPIYGKAELSSDEAEPPEAPLETTPRSDSVGRSRRIGTVPGSTSIEDRE
ncbi:MAG: oxyanion-translocating ATPase [Candidatus Scalindua rubra]|uniref:arsenite-transporting ATPase n=1 Tax=Candidatus Scalindua rubra TaxID=1872076 RepID=A0A1E3X4Y1_9BACT|nr:MAG: oxyanion-translocating ATPase [Candidatus Scalindua rubra]